MGKQFYLTMTEWSDLTMTNMLYLLKHKHYFLCEKAVMREVFHDLFFRGLQHFFLVFWTDLTVDYTELHSNYILALHWE